jgi:hypothetical protein
MFSADQVAERLDGLTFAEAAATLGEFESYSRSAALVLVLYRSPTGRRHRRSPARRDRSRLGMDAQIIRNHGTTLTSRPLAWASRMIVLM